MSHWQKCSVVCFSKFAKILSCYHFFDSDIIKCVQYKDLKWHMKDIRVWKRSYSFKFNTYVAKLLWWFEWNTDRQLYKEFCNIWGKIVENCKCQAFICTRCLKFYITKIPAVWPIESWNYAKKVKTIIFKGILWLINPF